MKTRFLFAALLLLAFGSVKAQDTITVVKRGADAKQADTVLVVTPNMSELPGLMQELGVYLQHLTDSVHWDTFEEDMERWGQEMEEWGRKMERWGEQFEGAFEAPGSLKSSENSDDPVRSIRVGGSGDVCISQSPDKFSLHCGDSDISRHYMKDGALILSGSSDYDVSVPHLEEVVMHSSGDVLGRGTLRGNTLHLVVMGSGDLKMNVDYDTINVQMSGSGDVTLQGQCKVLNAEIMGSGDLKIQQLVVGDSHINATGSGEAYVNKSGGVTSYHHRKSCPPTHRSLVFDPYWNGFEAGLNMLIDAPQEMELRPLRCWYFGFNIADVGVAFNRRHTVGLFTGVGLGWNNFSWNNPVVLEFDHENTMYTIEPIEAEQAVKNTKHGVLFLQAPLMFEVRPTRFMYIDAGVTGGLRIAQWNRVKLEDGTQDKHYYGSSINRFKLDASLRVGGDGLGFFANYALLPLFTMGDTEVHPVSFGFSIDF